MLVEYIERYQFLSKNGQDTVSDLPSLPATSGVSQFCLYLLVSRLMKVNLPVITNLSNLLVSLPLSPIFLAIHLLFCISSNFSYRKTQMEPSITHCWFWIRFLFTSDWKFWWWNNFQNVVKKCTQRLIKLVWRNFFRRKVQWKAFKLKWKEVFWFVYV